MEDPTTLLLPNLATLYCFQTEQLLVVERPNTGVSTTTLNQV